MMINNILLMKKTKNNIQII